MAECEVSRAVPHEFVEKARVPLNVRSLSLVSE